MAVPLSILFAHTAKILQEKQIELRVSLAALTLSLCLALSFAFGSGVSDDQVYLNYRSSLLYLSILSGTIFFWSLFVSAWTALGEQSKTDSRDHCANQWRPAKTFIVAMIVMLACWLPIFLASYPGFLNYDAGSIYLGEWAQYQSGELNNHHSVMHTLILGSFIQFGIDATGAPNAGVAAFSAVQSFLSAGVFSYSIVWLKRNGAPLFVRIIALAFWSLSPLVSMFVFSSNSDTLFAVCFFFALILLYDCLKSDFFVPRFIALAAVAFLASALRPNAPFVFAIIVALAFFLSEGRVRQATITSLLAALLAFFVWNGPISEAIGVQKSSLQTANAFSLPLQQLAYSFEQNVLSENELATLHDNGYQDPAAYKPGLSDYARSSIVEMSKSELVKNWISIGLNHPGSYMDAFILQTKSAWSPYSWIDSATSEGEETSLYECMVKDPATSESKLPGLLSALESISTNLTLQKVPFLALLVSVPFYFALLLMATAASIAGKKKSNLLICLGLLALVFSVLLGPGVITRYYLALIMFAPIFAFFIYDATQKS